MKRFVLIVVCLAGLLNIINADLNSYGHSCPVCRPGEDCNYPREVNCDPNYCYTIYKAGKPYVMDCASKSMVVARIGKGTGCGRLNNGDVMCSCSGDVCNMKGFDISEFSASSSTSSQCVYIVPVLTFLLL
ncbi:hypothetical protein M3Y97_00997400 [Aphelenchoides bicaudatus]|nr:hypothetical protein M3Y97_00997400 [Aphelenchoides bicaudatus]